MMSRDTRRRLPARPSFDIVQTKSPLDLSMEDRTRVQNLALDIVMFGQGIPFFHAGSEMLRSKSLDKDSYNSGDWFNAIDFTYDLNGNRLSRTDARGNTTTFSYNPVYRLTLLTDALGNRTTSTYDAVGNLLINPVN